MGDIVTPTPTTHDATAIVRAALDEEPASINRFPTGLCHFGFDVMTRSGRRMVVRIAEPDNANLLRGAVYWSAKLRPLGVPLPAMLDVDVDARRSPFPSILLDRLPGTDLGHVYPQLSLDQKRSIATRIVDIQRLVASLPEGRGYGFATSYDSMGLVSWSDVVNALLDRSARWIANAGVIRGDVVDHVRQAARAFENDFAAVRPTPFLDDTTTKNVIIHAGQLSGIVDVDQLCFGDPLFTPALTQMSLLASGYATDYIDCWCDALELPPSSRRRLTFYTAIFCVNFLAEIGQTFNAEASSPADPKTVTKLHGILDRLLASLVAP